MSGLSAAITCRRGPLELDVELTVGPGETVALLGPNGAGKSTVVAVLAGLVPTARADVVLEDQVLDRRDPPWSLPPEQRPVGVVFQDLLLFPHLSALGNVAFGLRARGVRRREADRRAAAWLERVGLGDRAGARVRELSGGQAQRVALARALALEPALLLLDEPLAALDATTRQEVRAEVRRQLSRTAGVRILVTHDPVEAAGLADRVVIIEAGRVVQTGSVAEVTARPRSRYVADLVGLNLYRGSARGGVVTLAGGATLVAADRLDGDVWAVVHPRAVALHRSRPAGTPRNVWPVGIASVDRAGDRVRASLHGPLPLVAEVTLAGLDDLGGGAGALWASVKASEVGLYPA